MQKNTRYKSVALRKLAWSRSLLLAVSCLAQDWPANRWIELCRDPLGGRRVMRGATEDEPGVPRPDLNIVFDQVTYRPENNSLYYFTGGLTAQYDVGRRRWRDLRPAHSPPPVTAGSLAYDPLHDEIVLF